jgi:site-specific DNA recombinase
MSKAFRCAIYTRKSTEEGLEQDFNSLHAQREACEAYILSQTHEGWTCIPTLYDDGGFSGGSMARPALKAIIEDIEKGRIDILVVYKVDRLTRSLADFAKLVEVFDERDVSFVSVTQAFNTTSSMGRLTLHVLLSFAQFEREVTAERIRDKFRASKEKGMWMGGRPPLGYDVRDRKLEINKDERRRVIHIFERYLALGSVLKLMQELNEDNIQSKSWITQKGKVMSGADFTRGALYSLLQNPVYIGKIRHKELTHEGQHNAIVSQTLWDDVQARLQENRVIRTTRSNAKAPSLLAGLIVDQDGSRFSPRHSKRKGKRYRYYVGTNMTLPAHEIERAVIDELVTLLCDPSRLTALLQSTDPANIESYITHAATLAMEIKTHPCPSTIARLVNRVTVGHDRIEITIGDGPNLLAGDSNGQLDVESNEDHLVITKEMHIKRSSHGKRIVLGRTHEGVKADPSLLQAIARSHQWLELMKQGTSYKDTANQEGIDQRHVARTIRLAFLAPDITEAVLKGKAPQDLSADGLFKLSKLPADWPEQSTLLGFS